MNVNSVYILRTTTGMLHLMLVKDPIVAFHDDSGAWVHHVPALMLEAPWGETRVPFEFSSLCSNRAELVVCRLQDQTDCAVGFFATNPNWRAWNAWGYVWNVNQAEASHWERADRLADMMRPDDPPRASPLSQLSTELTRLVANTRSVQPRVVAITTPTYMAARESSDIRDLQAWLTDYRLALDEIAFPNKHPFEREDS